MRDGKVPGQKPWIYRLLWLWLLWLDFFLRFWDDETLEFVSLSQQIAVNSPGRCGCSELASPSHIER